MPLTPTRIPLTKSRRNVSCDVDGFPQSFTPLISIPPWYLSVICLFRSIFRAAELFEDGGYDSVDADDGSPLRDTDLGLFKAFKAGD